MRERLDEGVVLIVLLVPIVFVLRIMNGLNRNGGSHIIDRNVGT